MVLRRRSLNEPLILFQLCFDSLLLVTSWAVFRISSAHGQRYHTRSHRVREEIFRGRLQYDAVIEIERLTRFDRIADARIDYGIVFRMIISSHVVR